MALGGNWRVPIVIRPLDRTLVALRWALVLGVLLVGALPVFRALGGSFTGHHAQWFRILGGLAAGVFLCALVQLPGVRTHLDRVFVRARRRVAIACNHENEAEHADGRFACRLTPEILRAPLFPYEQQHNAVRALADACGDAPHRSHWFVEGRSGSGKTRMALLLVQTLIRDPNLFEFGARCYLYDFAGSPSAQDDLLRRLATSRHDGAVVLVDNFQLVRPRVLRAVTRLLVDQAGPGPERLLVFLARPGEAWNLSPGADVRLLSEAKRGNRHLELGGPRSESVAYGVSEIDATASRLIRDLQEEPVASAAQLHLAQVVARNGAVPPEVAGLLSLLGGQDDGPGPGVTHLLGIVTALSMHAGAFSRGDLLRALRVAGAVPGPGSGPVKAWRTWRAFRRLHRIGLVVCVHLPGTRYLFHEAVAELCIDRLWSLPAFGAPFGAVGRWRTNALLAAGDALAAWLRAVEVGAQEIAEVSFDDAISRGAYGRMARCVRRARSRYELTPTVRLQLAILLDRIGDFAGSRAEFTDELVRKLSPSSELAAVLTATRAEASHDAASKAGIDALCRHSDRFVAIVGEYWKLHMAGHRGRFDAEELLALATEALGLLEGRETHWRVYSLNRMHVDSLRHHYLGGGVPVRAVAASQRRALGDFLRPRLPIHEAFHVLYTQAHLVGHVLLPQLAIFGQLATDDDAALAGVTLAEVSSISALVMTTRRLYTRARDEFWQYGDREADYIRADLLNAELIQDGADLDALTGDLGRYARFIEDTGFEDLASYPHLYFLRWHVLQHYAAIYMSSDPRSADEHLGEAARRLREIVACDTAARNEYGLFRADLLSLLLRGVRDPFDQRELTNLRERAVRRGYGFEARLAAHLVERDGISSEELRRIFRFYPFVHQ